MTRTLYLNLPVRDLQAATRMYAAIGCRKNDEYSDHQSSSMVWSDTITFQLLTTDYFATFANKPVADAHGSTEMLIALPVETREEVDRLVAVAAAHGGRSDPRAPMDLGWLYNRAFEDVDGHTFEVLCTATDAA
jgi:predicted lactoylglutathione lyase